MRFLQNLFLPHSVLAAYASDIAAVDIPRVRAVVNARDAHLLLLLGGFVLELRRDFFHMAVMLQLVIFIRTLASSSTPAQITGLDKP